MSADFLEQLAAIVGRRNVYSDPKKSERYRKGFRSGSGEAEAVVFPSNLLQLWQILKACVAADRIVIMQAANTGLTEGSTPNGSYDRKVVVINTLRLDRIHVIRGGRQILSHPGGTLYKLEKLLKPLGRQPHSVIGSSCIGASVIGGVCNNSGGALVQRGPAYTELSLYAQLHADGTLELVNHLGIRLGDTPEEILTRLDQGAFDESDIADDAGQASDQDYEERVRQIDSDRPARFNADPSRLHEASGCAGKLAVFAVRLDTYPAATGEKVYYLGTDNPDRFTRLRRRMLAELPELPVSGEYLHKDIFDIGKVYGKDTLLMIQLLGTSFLPFFFTLKGRIDAWLNKVSFLPQNLVDKSMQFLAGLLPEALPQRILVFREDFDHHLILKVGPKIAAQTEVILTEVLGAESWFLCDEKEANKAMLHRFAAAGAAVRYQAVHADEVEDILALDIALRRNDKDWLETLPEEIEKDLVAKLYYGHFFCHVFHQDYIVRKGANPKLIKQKMLALLDQRGAEYPAEHNVGHIYEAKPELAAFYEKLDPTNSFNPGIGKTSKQKRHPRSAA